MKKKNNLEDTMLTRKLQFIRFKNSLEFEKVLATISENNLSEVFLLSSVGYETKFNTDQGMTKADARLQGV
jgi:hypothetical protein